MINEIIKNELDKYKDDIKNINYDIKIDCITIFSLSKDDYDNLNNELKDNVLVDEMTSGNLYYLENPIDTKYGKLYFIKVRKHDDAYNNYRISVDFTVDDYEKYKFTLDDPVIKNYDTFELIQLKNDKSIINIVSLSAFSDYIIGNK